MNDEIHIKIGGDHGGGSFKMSYQVTFEFLSHLKSTFVVLIWYSRARNPSLYMVVLITLEL